MDADQIIREAQREQFEKNNLVEAERLLLEAAALGSGHAAHELGVLYIAGGPGVKADKEKSRYWLEVSFESGYESTIATDPEWFRRNET